MTKGDVELDTGPICLRGIKTRHRPEPRPCPFWVHNLTSPFVNLAQAATYEARSAGNPANFRPYRWRTGGEPLPQKQHNKATKA